MACLPLFLTAMTQISQVPFDIRRRPLKPLTPTTLLRFSLSNNSLIGDSALCPVPHIFHDLIVFRCFAKLRSDYWLCHCHVCPSVRPHVTTRRPLDGFSRSSIFEDFSIICWELPSFIKIGQE
jgi:hypothetical protein